MVFDDDSSSADLSVTARKILSYLVEHPQARDTLDGLVQWWLLEMEITSQTAQMRAGLDELSAQALIVAHHSTDGHVHYSINHQKLDEIKAKLGEEPHQLMKE